MFADIETGVNMRKRMVLSKCNIKSVECLHNFKLLTNNVN